MWTIHLYCDSYGTSKDRDALITVNGHFVVYRLGQVIVFVVQLGIRHVFRFAFHMHFRHRRDPM